jgi:hypothetical protein
MIGFGQVPCDEGVTRAGPKTPGCAAANRPRMLAATVLGSSMAFIDGSVVNVALSAIQQGLAKAIRRHGVPEKVTVDGREANAAAIRGYNEAHGTTIVIRQLKYLNNVVEQDHRSVKQVTRPMLGVTSFDTAQCTLAGIEFMPMFPKGATHDDPRPPSASGPAHWHRLPTRGGPAAGPPGAGRLSWLR